MTEMTLPQEATLIKSAEIAVFLNCHRLRALWPHYSGLAIKNELFHSSGNYEACLSVLYALGTQLYHPLQIASSSSTQRGSPWFLLVAVGVLSLIQLFISTHPLTPLSPQRMSWSLKTYPDWSASGFRGSKAWERLTGQVIVTLFLRSSFLIWFPQFFLTGTFYVLNPTGKQLFYESAWKSLLHSGTAAFGCFQ